MDLDIETRAIVESLKAELLIEAQAGETLSVILRIPGLDTFFRKVQDRAEELMPDLFDFETEYHVTLAYASGMTMETITAALPEVLDVIAGKSFTLDIGPVTSLVNQKGEGVLYLAVNNDELTDLHFAIRAILTRFGGVFTFPRYIAHVTMGYRPTPIDGQAVEILNLGTPVVGVVAGSKDVKVTRKSGDEWVRVA